jgi:hypothetical protein
LTGGITEARDHLEHEVVDRDFGGEPGRGLLSSKRLAPEMSLRHEPPSSRTDACIVN